MNKSEFLQQLAGALGGMPPEERELALQYYEDYFADAGEGNEAQVISDLGDPASVAQAILNDYRELAPISDKAGETPKSESRGSGAAYWNARYQESRGNKSSANAHTDAPKSAAPRRAGIHPLVLVLLIIFAIPLGVPLIATAFALVMTGIALIAALAVALIAILFATLLAGVILCVRGFLFFPISFFSAFATIGTGLILSAIGLVSLFIAIKFFAVVIPACIRGIVRLCRMPFERRNAS